MSDLHSECSDTTSLTLLLLPLLMYNLPTLSLLLQVLELTFHVWSSATAPVHFQLPAAKKLLLPADICLLVLGSHSSLYSVFRGHMFSCPQFSSQQGMFSNAKCCCVCGFHSDSTPTVSWNAAKMHVWTNRVSMGLYGYVQRHRSREYHCFVPLLAVLPANLSDAHGPFKGGISLLQNSAHPHSWNTISCSLLLC